MDVADWLQALPTAEGERFLPKLADGEIRKHLTPTQFSKRFYASPKGKAILQKLDSPVRTAKEDEDMIKEIGSVKYANGALTNLKLLAGRELLLWWRDKYQVSFAI